LPQENVFIRMQPRVYVSDDVNISATRVSRNSGIAYSEITNEEIAKQNLGQDIPYILQYMPSVVNTSDAGTGIGYTGIRVRGSDASRTNVTVNGIPVNDAESQQMYWVDLPDFATSVNNIQLQRGVGTSTNGAGAFGASLNMQTSVVNPDAFGIAESAAGSFQTLRNRVQFGTGMMKDHFSVDGRLSKIYSGGFIDRGTSDLKSYFLNSGYYGKKNSLRFIAFSGKEKTYQAWYGVPESRLRNDVEGMNAYIQRNYLNAEEANNLLSSGSRRYNFYTYPNQTDNYQQDNYQLISSNAMGEHWLLNAALHYTKGRGYYEEFKHDEYFSSYGLPDQIIGSDTILSTDLVRRLWLDNDFYGLTASGIYSEKNLQLIIGGAANRYAGRHYGEITWSSIATNYHPGDRYYSDTAEKTDVNLYTKLHWSIGKKWSFGGDMQVRSITYSFLGFNDSYLQQMQNASFFFLNPKANVHFQFTPDQSFYASLGIGHKEPVRNDFVFSTPSSRPKPEQLTDVETGYLFNRSVFRVQANLYYMYYEEQLVLNGKINDVGEHTMQNVPQSYREGIELEAQYQPFEKIMLIANTALSKNKIKSYTEYMDNYDASDGSQVITNYGKTTIAFSPSQVSAFTIRILPVKNLTIDFATKSVSKQYLDNTMDESRRLDAYVINNLIVNYTLTPRGIKKIEFRLMVNNLFNQEYESNGYTFGYRYGGENIRENFYFPQAGINFLGGISLSF